jgi:hypothetical protein
VESHALTSNLSDSFVVENTVSFVQKTAAALAIFIFLASPLMRYFADLVDHLDDRDDEIPLCGVSGDSAPSVA